MYESSRWNFAVQRRVTSTRWTIEATEPSAVVPIAMMLVTPAERACTWPPRVHRCLQFIEGDPLRASQAKYDHRAFVRQRLSRVREVGLNGGRAPHRAPVQAEQPGRQAIQTIR